MEVNYEKKIGILASGYWVVSSSSWM